MHEERSPKLKLDYEPGRRVYNVIHADDDAGVGCTAARLTMCRRRDATFPGTEFVARLFCFPPIKCRRVSKDDVLGDNK